jgi:hypothetical protein
VLLLDNSARSRFDRLPAARVLHYDAIAEHTSLEFDNVWLAPRRSL